MKFTFKEFNTLYPTDDACLDKIFQLRYSGQKQCPTCGKDTKFHRVKKRMCYECQYCGYQVYPLAGTVFEKSRTKLTLWFHAAYLMTSSKHGVSAMELKRHIGVTYKCAWRMAHQLRKLIGEEDFEFKSKVQVDETYCGGVRRNGKRGRSNISKTPVFGIAEAKGRIKMFQVPDTKRTTLAPLIKAYIPPASLIMSDEYRAYSRLSKMGYFHGCVNHSQFHYVDIHGNNTNAIEGAWSIFKRSIRGTHVWVSKKHLQLYLNEFEFRYNNRKSTIPLFDVVLNKLPADVVHIDRDTGEITLQASPTYAEDFRNRFYDLD